MTMDAAGIATLFAAFGALITSVVGAWVTVSNTRATSQAAERAATTAKETKAQTEATAHVVDGKMAEMMKLVADAALAKGALTEQTAQRDREAAAALALSRGVGTVPVVVPPIPPVTLLPTAASAAAQPDMSAEMLIAALTKLLAANKVKS